MTIKVVCVDDSNRPESLPSSRWIKKDEHYTILEIVKMRIQGGVLGCKLQEINNDDMFPYTHFALTRFRPLSDQELQAEVAVQELIKETELIS